MSLLFDEKHMWPRAIGSPPLAERPHSTRFMKKRSRQAKSVRDLLIDWQFSPDREKSKKYVKHEFQDYGVRLAHKLNDISHKSLYIKLAKGENRNLLEKAYRFAIDYPGMEGKNKGKLFMWALGKLRRGEPLSDGKKKDVSRKTK